MQRHTARLRQRSGAGDTLDIGGEYAYRMRGESHAWTPDAVAALQHAVRGNSPDRYREYSAHGRMRERTRMNDHPRPVHDQGGRGCGRKPVSIDEVEPAAEIVKRFSTGAMSFGSI